MMAALFALTACGGDNSSDSDRTGGSNGVPIGDTGGLDSNIGPTESENTSTESRTEMGEGTQQSGSTEVEVPGPDATDVETENVDMGDTGERTLKKRMSAVTATRMGRFSR